MRNFIELWTIRARAIKRLMMWHGLSGRLPLYLVPEYPKSGGTWFSQMLSDALELPFYRNTSSQPICSSVMSGHLLYSPRFKNVTVVIRDGRDTVVSAYYYMCFKNEINRQFGVDRYRKALQFEDYDDIRSNLPRFIEYLYGEHAKKHFHFGWGEFIDSWFDQSASFVRYEDLLTQPVDELRRIFNGLTGRELSEERAAEIVDKYSFRKMSGRKQGQENRTSFVRKGVAGDWKNHFSAEAREVFHRFAGDQLIRAGYEQDDSWVAIDTLAQSSVD